MGNGIAFSDDAPLLFHGDDTVRQIKQGLLLRGVEIDPQPQLPEHGSESWRGVHRNSPGGPYRGSRLAGVTSRTSNCVFTPDFPRPLEPLL